MEQPDIVACVRILLLFLLYGLVQDKVGDDFLSDRLTVMVGEVGILVDEDLRDEALVDQLAGILLRYGLDDFGVGHDVGD